MLNTEEEIDLYDDISNPLDGVEEIMLNNDWTFDRPNTDEMSVDVSGHYGTYKINFTWQPEHSAIQFFCSTDLEIPPQKMVQACQVMNKINTHLWMGHFDIRPEAKNKTGEATMLTPCFRHTSLFRGMTHTSGTAHMEDLIDVALHECERYYMSFKLLSKADHISVQDISLALMDVAGVS